MNILKLISVALLAAVISIGIFIMNKNQHIKASVYDNPTYPSFIIIQSEDDFASLFPKTPYEIKKRAANSIAELKKRIEVIVAIPIANRTFENTAKALDNLSMSYYGVLASALQIVSMVNPDAAMRDAALQTIIQMESAGIDLLSNNKDLYLAFKDYGEQKAPQEQLTDEQRYFIEQNLLEFVREGLDQAVEKLARLGQLKKDLSQLSTDFDHNIASDARFITVSEKELTGLKPDFIAALPKIDNGLIKIGTDSPTYLAIMRNCTNPDLRKRLFIQYANRAVEKNDAVLHEIIKKRTELAQLLGYESFEAFDLADQMVKTPARARAFLDELLARVKPKVKEEFAQLTAKLPESVQLTKEGQIQPWDVVFVKNYFKEEKAINDDEVSQYFPMEQTIKGLFSIYEQLLGLKLVSKKVTNVWDPEVRLVEVHDAASKELLGYLYLDLHPRPNKYTHACHSTMVRSTYNPDGLPNIQGSIVIANFPKPTDTKPSLLKLSDVSTFFHEFGHALHAVLGRTHLASLSGTSVKRDFVELPSQMLEEWLKDKEILKMVSSHYKTGQPLPDKIIDSIIEFKNYDSGMFVNSQGMFAKLSLGCFDGICTNVHGLMKQLHEEHVGHVRFEPEDHWYASFGHLTGYGAKYYGYLWSKVFALDMFDHIRKQGLLNPEVGMRYRTLVLQPGGTKDPNELLKDFLGRAPTQEAFLRDMGL